MMDGGAVVPLSVVFFDGERNIDVGEVRVHPSLNFKDFQCLLSQKIGIPPYQVSVSLARIGSNRQFPITGKVNFAAIAREKGAFFLVKRSRNSRRNKSHKDSKSYDDYYSQHNQKSLPENVMLLRRNVGFDNQQPFSGFKATPILDPVEYDRRLRNLQIERERYMMNMGLRDLGLAMESRGGVLVCEECLRAKQTGSEGEFHLCVNDKVIVGFRSPAGPIARPSKNSG